MQEHELHVAAREETGHVVIEETVDTFEIPVGENATSASRGTRKAMGEEEEESTYICPVPH